MDEQLETLAQIRRHLEPGGTLAFDLFVPLYQVISASEWRDKIDEDELHSENSGVSIEIKIKHRPEQQILRVTNTYFSRQDGKTRLATMNYRYVFRYEMEALLRLSGFQTIEVFGGFEKQQYNYHSGIMIFIAKRI
jgi:hypothetical protein